MSIPDRKTRMDKAARGTATPAFTLVESVVVGSVILFAIAVLVPSVRAARERGHVAACLANLRTIGQASLTYAGEDPNEIFIPVPNWAVLDYFTGALEWGGKAGRGEPANPNDPTTSRYGTGAYRGPAHRPLNPYLYPGGFVDYNPPDGTPNPGPGRINYLNDANLDLDIYRCPADTGYAGGGFLYTGGRHDRDERHFRAQGLSAYDHFGNSYVANTFSLAGGSLGRQGRSYSVYLQPLSQVPSPAHSIAYQETPSRFVWLWGSWQGSGCEWANWEANVQGHFATVPGWHGSDFHFNVAFADGHAATVEMQGCLRPAPHLGPENYPSGQCGPGVDDYECLRCVTVRGPGWQMDTLPAEPVPIPYWWEYAR